MAMKCEMQAAFNVLPKDDRWCTPELRAWGVTEGDGSRPRRVLEQGCSTTEYLAGRTGSQSRPRQFGA
eukprot:3371771-Lingulodinium_polyedra.AAC.1